MNLYAHLLLVCGAGIFNGIGMDFAILQLNAIGNQLHVGCSDSLVAMHMINLLLQILGVGELAGQFTVIGEKQHTRGVAVKTANGIHTFAAGTLDEVHHGLAVLGIIASGDIVLGLVEQDVHLLLDGDRLVMEHHMVGTLHLGTQLGDNHTVYRYHTSLDIGVGLTATAHTCIGKEAVQTDGCIRIYMGFLVFNLFLHAVLGMRIVVGCTLLAWTLGTLLIAAITAG